MVNNSPPRVLFVSKPIVAPWHDGSKNLVRDVAMNLTWARPTVLTTPGASPLGPRVLLDPVYADSGRFAPGLMANARVMKRLVLGDSADIWHFVFAPNAASSTAARAAMRVRRAFGWKGVVVQTVASAPRDFDSVGPLIFGDHVVVLSEWMLGRMIGSGIAADRLTVIPPCALAPVRADAAKVAAFRQEHGLSEGPIVLYPGDYEVSRGAETVANAVGAIVRAVPDASVVFACRAKTPRAGEAKERIVAELRRRGQESVTRHLGEVRDMSLLFSAASVIAFPVDDLYGKVDLPLVLLEAMSLGVPMVLARGGPLESLTTAQFVDPADSDALAAEVVRLLQNEGERTAHASRGERAYRERFTPQVVANAYDQVYRELLAKRAAE